MLLDVIYSFDLCRFTARITELMRVLDDLNKGQYQRTMVSDKGNGRYKNIIIYNVISMVELL